MLVKQYRADIFKLRSYIMDKAYKGGGILPKWDGVTHISYYVRRKVVQNYIINKIKDMTNVDVIKIELTDQCKEAIIYIDPNSDILQLDQDIYDGGLSGAIYNDTHIDIS